MHLPVAGLYVHVPFRRTARPTDDGYTVVTDASDFSRFETALCRELRYYARAYAPEERMSTVYAGGGRPSLLPLSSVHAVLTTLVDAFDASAFEEATAEVTPADATRRYLHGLKRMGFDRLSLPILSFFPKTLRDLKAPHSIAEAMRALRVARETGFAVSVDLLFGGPEQTLDTWEATLRLAVEMDISHVTITEASAGEDEGKRADMLELAMTFLQSEGYEQYELTHFARPGHRSTHQENYYAHGNYLGIGPSAQSFWWPNRAQAPRARRWTNVRDVERYAQLLRQRYPPVTYRETLNRSTLAEEYVLLRLRTAAGLDLDRLKEHYGVNLRTQKTDVLARLRDEGLIHDDPDTVRLTLRGRLVTDAITQRLLPA
jgi:oxygen-independent coproporphyrinogen-3 oxidase